MQGQWEVIANKAVDLGERLERHLREHGMEGQRMKEQKEEEKKGRIGMEKELGMEGKKGGMGINRMNLATEFISNFKVQGNTIEYIGEDRKDTAVYGAVTFSECSRFPVKVLGEASGSMGIGVVD